MRSRRGVKITAVVVLVVALVAAGGFVLLRYLGADAVRDMVVQRLEKIAGRDVAIAGDFALALALAPTVVAEGITVGNAPWGSQPAMVKADRIEVQLQAWPLLWEGDVLIDRLAVAGAEILLETNAEGEGNWSLDADEVPEETVASERRELLLSDLAIADAQLIWHDGATGRTEAVLVDRFVWRADRLTGELTLSGAGHYRERPFAVAGDLGPIADLIQGEDPYPVDLEGTFGDLRAAVEGRVSPDMAPGDIRLDVTLAGEQLASLSALLGTDLPPVGPYRLAATIAGNNAGGFTAEPLRATVGDAGALLLEAEGRVADLLAAAGIELEIEAEGASLAPAGELFGAEPPALGPYAAQGVLTGSAESLTLAGLTGTLGEEGALQVRVTDGRIENLLKAAGIDLRLAVKGPSVAALSDLVDRELPELGPYAAEGRLTGSMEALTLSDLAGRLGMEGALQVRVTDGRIEDLLEVGAVDVGLAVAGPSIAALGELFGVEPPALGPYTAEGRLTGSMESLTLSGLTSRIGPEDGALQVRVTEGEVADLLGVRVIGLALEAVGPSLAALGDLLGSAAELPGLGPYAVAGTLTGTPNALTLTGLTGAVGEEGSTVVRVPEGEIANVLTGEGIRVRIAAAGPDLAPLAAYAGLEEVGPFGPFEAGATLVGSLDTGLAVRDLAAAAGDEASRVRVSGAIARLLEAGGIDLAVAAAGSDLAALAPLVGPDLPPLGPYRVAARVKGAPEELSIEEIDAELAGSPLRGWLTVERPETDAAPRIEGELQSARLDLDRVLALVEGVETTEEETAAPPPEEEAEPGDEVGGMFPETPLPLDVLDAVEADLAFRADELVTGAAELRGVGFRLTLREGRLGVHDLTLRVAGGTVEGDVALDANEAETTAGITVRLNAEDIDVRNLLTGGSSATDKVVGQIDIDINLDSTGGTIDDLMDELEGGVTVAAEEGQIRDNRLKWLVPDLDILRVLPVFWGRGEDAVRVNCVIGKFDVDEGVAETDAMLDTRRMTVLGEGTVNLRQETVDLELQPAAKSRKLSSAAVPIEVEGPLTSPAVRPRIGEATGRAVRGILGGLLIPINQIAALFGKDAADACAGALRQARERVAAGGRGAGRAAAPPQ